MDSYIGIDVSKAPLDVASPPDGQSWTVTNDEAGLAALMPRLVALALNSPSSQRSAGPEPSVTRRTAFRS